jgi:hypothetical protein
VLTAGGRYPASLRWLLPSSTSHEPMQAEARRDGARHA